jgi:crotonobetainyl-CoA:carnitine CoA-transferase CaiB-like acyl-CoA transferase
MNLGDLGADVVKVEEPGVGDDSRHWGPPFSGGESAYFMSANRNKRGVAFNLKTAGGAEALWRLIESADALVENFRPGLMERLGFGYEAVHVRNPRLVYCSISGYGQDGPEASKPGYDIILQGTSGVSSVTGDPNGSPYRCGLPVCDILAGMFATQAILAALYARQLTGEGQLVETTLLGATVAAMPNFAGSYLMSGEAPARVGNSHPQIAPYDLVRSKDGYVNIACGNDDIWRRFCRALALDALLLDARFASNGARVTNRAALMAAIQRRTAELSTDELTSVLEDAGVPCGPIRDLRQVFESPQARHLGLAREMTHPTAGAIRVVRPPITLSETPTTLRLPPPTLGQHTDETLRELGFDDERIESLRAEGAIG